MLSVSERWHKERQRCRRDLWFLAKYVLGYKDVELSVHGQFMGNLQTFQEGKDFEGDQFTCKQLIETWRPSVPFEQLPGHRRNLFLIPRGHLKSTLCTISHTIQWIINYPNIRIVLASATEGQCEGFIDEIKKHFQYNEYFRRLFPEFVPLKNPKEFGNRQEFTVPARTIHRKEPTLSMVTLNSTISGWHFDVMKCDDLVDKENIRTASQIQTVKDFFAYLDPLVENYNKPEGWEGDWKEKGWLDLIGTIYHFSDLHYHIYESERAKPKDKRQWRMVVKSAAPNYPEGPTLWEARYPITALRAIETDPARGPNMLYSQYLMNPLPDKAGLVDDEKQLEAMATDIKDLAFVIPRMTKHVTVDLAGMEPDKKGQDNDDSVLNLHGFGTDGRLYFLRLFVGKFSPDEVIEKIFELYKQYPDILDFKIEKEAHARVLLPFLRKEMAKRNIWLPIVEIKRDNKTSKQQRIKGLQPFLNNGAIRFASNCGHWEKVKKQILYFPKYTHDDILDTMADALQNREGGITSEVMSQGRPSQGYATDSGMGVTARSFNEHLLFESSMPHEIQETMFNEMQEENERDTITGF